MADSAFTPEIDQTETARVTTVAASAPFLLMAHPARWGVVNGRVRPLLGRMVLRSGVSNVEEGRGGKGIRVGRAKAAKEERGWTVLPTTALPPSQGHRGSYLIRPDGRADVTLCYWEQTFPGSAVRRCDEVLRDQYLDWLRESGTIQPPRLYVLERLRDEARAEAEKAADKAQTVPSYKVAAKAALERVKIIDAEIEACAETAIPSGSRAVGVETDD
jgi:hypothetical protein